MLEAKESADSHRTARTDAALEQFYSTFQLFQATCDQAQEFVDSVRQRIGSECIVDEATVESEQSGNTLIILFRLLGPLSRFDLTPVFNRVWQKV